VDHGADAVYLGFRGASNARNFPGLNFSEDEAQRGRDYAHAAGAEVFVALNTNPSALQWEAARDAADAAVALGADALIIADLGLLHYVARRHPEQRLHLSVQGSATNYEAINFCARQFGVQRVVLPRVLSLVQVRNLRQRVDVEIEVFGFGSLCVMVEGRCQLSSYVTGESPNLSGVCSPAKSVRWEEDAHSRRSRLNGVLIDVYREGEPAGYPTLCKGRFSVGGHTFYALEEPTSLNVLDILPQLLEAGVAAIKVEVRQRSPVYVAQITRVLRAALDECIDDPAGFAPHPEWIATLDQLAEGSTHTLGAYHRPWQ
jgi:O2-independent ubiquinone biosynthesis protein UbiU